MLLHSVICIISQEKNIYFFSKTYKFSMLGVGGRDLWRFNGYWGEVPLCTEPPDSLETPPVDGRLMRTA